MKRNQLYYFHLIIHCQQFIDVLQVNNINNLYANFRALITYITIKYYKRYLYIRFQ